MAPTEVLVTLDLDRWDGPFDDAVRGRALAALEAGSVLQFPRLPFAVSDAETPFLSARASGEGRKNVSFNPATGAVSNTALTGADAEVLAGMMRRWSDTAHAFASALFPSYAAHLERGRASFRPVEVQGRPQSVRHDDRLLHVDAFPARPLAGRRILRVFSNVAPDGAVREWQVGGPFEEYARVLAPRVPRPKPGSAALLRMLGLTKGTRTPYDALMLGLHDAGKMDAAWQQGAEKHDVGFAPGTTWMCFTDRVLHAALAGHCALEQTLHIPVAAMAHPELAPLRILEEITSRRLA